MACSASREAEAGRVSASRAGGHAPRTGERVARKSASRACFCVTVVSIAPRLFFPLDFSLPHVTRVGEGLRLGEEASAYAAWPPPVIGRALACHLARE